MSVLCGSSFYHVIITLVVQVSRVRKQEQHNNHLAVSRVAVDRRRHRLQTNIQKCQHHCLSQGGGSERCCCVPGSECGSATWNRSSISGGRIPTCHKGASSHIAEVRSDATAAWMTKGCGEEIFRLTPQDDMSIRTLTHSLPVLQSNARAVC